MNVELDYKKIADEFENDDNFKVFGAKAYFCKKMDTTQAHLSLFLNRGVPHQCAINAIQKYRQKTPEEKAEFFADLKNLKPKTKDFSQIKQNIFSDYSLEDRIRDIIFKALKRDFSRIEFTINFPERIHICLTIKKETNKK